MSTVNKRNGSWRRIFKFSFMYDIIKPIMRMKSIANFNFYALLSHDDACHEILSNIQSLVNPSFHQWTIQWTDLHFLHSGWAFFLLLKNHFCPSQNMKVMSIDTILLSTYSILETLSLLLLTIFGQIKRNLTFFLLFLFFYLTSCLIIVPGYQRIAMSMRQKGKASITVYTKEREWKIY